jgi:glycosyltransferase involved in cell wall biosynthesis
MSRTLLFLSCDPQAPSFRYRIAPAIEYLRQLGYHCEIERFPRGRYLRRLFDLRAKLRGAAAVVLAKIQITPPEAFWLRRLNPRVALDIDDAIYVRKPRGPQGQPEDSRWRRAKFAATCRATALVIAGNAELAKQATPHAHRVEIVPTPLDCARYARPVALTGRPENDMLEAEPTQAPRVVWVGLPENLIYLEFLRPLFAELQQRWPQLRLRVVCSRFPDWPDTLLEPVIWSPDSEVQALTGAHIGIMPLTDNAWTRGKCAFKLLQYMAAGLPCIASPVGANCEAMHQGDNGFLATTPGEWQIALTTLLASAQLRREFGARGLARVRRYYDVGQIKERTAALILEMMEQAS